MHQESQWFQHIEKGILKKFCAPNCQTSVPPHLLLSISTRGTNTSLHAQCHDAIMLSYMHTMVPFLAFSFHMKWFSLPVLVFLISKVWNECEEMGHCMLYYITKWPLSQSHVVIYLYTGSCFFWELAGCAMLWASRLACCVRPSKPTRASTTSQVTRESAATCKYSSHISFLQHEDETWKSCSCHELQ